MIELVFWAGIAVLAYAYVGYPAILAFLAKIIGSEKEASVPETALPSISVLIAAYNEQRSIGAKIRNTLSIDYPGDLIEVWVASDGSIDATNSIVSALAAQDKRVRLLEFPRMGKSCVLTKAMERMSTEVKKSDIVVFSDANTEFDLNAFKFLASRFSDQAIGCVCGKLVYRNPGRIVSGKGESSYWKYETALKRLESRLGYISGANGAIYAIRRELFEPLPKGTINDDFVISMRVVAKGYKSIYEEKALAYEDVATSAGGEFKRHVRDGAGHYIALWHLVGLLNPFLGIRAFIHWSHRIFRWSAPFILPALLIVNVMLFEYRPYKYIFAGQAAFYAAAILGFLMVGNSRLPFVFYVPYYFCNLNLAIFMGFLKAVSGRQKMTWERTERI
ncbi:MAG: glycosyltransferase family 2 protein [Deltaproteobacteria bacterium]|nr:glycosyltransferase family 2 protein [Deltaproteobacteria bacterium]